MPQLPALALLCFPTPSPGALLLRGRDTAGDIVLSVTRSENSVRHLCPVQQPLLRRLGFDVELTSQEIPNGINVKDTGGVCVCL